MTHLQELKILKSMSEYAYEVEKISTGHLLIRHDSGVTGYTAYPMLYGMQIGKTIKLK